MARLKETYLNEIVDAMMKKFEYKNVMQVPKLDKIVINMGVGEAKENSKVLDTAISDLEIITGQKAVVTRAKKSVANFKLREGQPICCKVTLISSENAIGSRICQRYRPWRGRLSSPNACTAFNFPVSNRTRVLSFVS